MSRGVVQEVGRRFLVGSEAEVSRLFDWYTVCLKKPDRYDYYDITSPILHFTNSFGRERPESVLIWLQ